MKPPLPPDEADRIEALRSLGILDTAPERAFDELVALAAGLCGTPISLVSLVDEDRQWFKAKVGIDVPETPREVAFCAHAILQDAIFEVPDASLDARFAKNPLVTDDPKIRFYAGVPLRTSDGHNVGTLCVVGHEPRTLTLDQRATLETLGRAVTAHLELRRALRSAEELDERRRRVERELLASTELLGALTSIASSALGDLDLAKAFDRTLSLLMSATGSELGFIGEAIPGPDGELRLKVHASVDMPAASFGDAPDGSSCMDRLFRVMVTADAPLASNDPPCDARFECVGPHREFLRSFLGIPLRTGGELSGMVGLGNAPGGYELANTSKVLPILATCASIIGSIRIERQRLGAEAALRLSEERYRQLVDASLDAIVGVDTAGAITSWNPQAEAIFGWPASEAIGRLLAETIIPEEEREKYFLQGGSALLSAVDAGLPGQRAEVTALRRSGARFPAEIAISTFPSKQGPGFAVFLRDITDKAESERAIRKSEQRLRQTLAAANAGAWEWDFVKGRGFWSDEDYRLLGYEPGSVEPSLEAMLAHVHPEDRPGAVAKVQSAVEAGEPFEYDYRVVRPDGSFRWVRDVGDVECDDAGRPLRVSGIVTDITERKLAERKLLEQSNQLSTANAQLERANRLKDEFLAAMSHELRTPLNAVLGLAEGLHAGVFGPLTEQQGQQIAIIEDSGRHLLELINDILDLSKIGAGKLELTLAPVVPSAICDASLRMVRETALRKQIRLTSSYDPELSLVVADSLRLRQIIVNLLSNAVKFTGEGGSVMVETAVDKESGRAFFSVSDTGIGIDPDDLHRLFKPFVQLDSRLARGHAGTGLGLSLVQQLAELHGGGVSVETQPGKGSRFTVALPWDARTIDDIFASAEASGPEPKAATTIPTRTPAPDEIAPPLLLLVDDHVPNIRAMGSYLTAVGYRVAVAHSGLEAIERAQAEHPALVVMDIQMPGIDGLETTRRLRRLRDFERTPIIALTALAMPNDRERSIAAGADEYMTKPVQLSTLAETAHRLLEQPAPQSARSSHARPPDPERTPPPDSHVTD